MLEVYLFDANEKNVINSNDAWFNIHWSEYDFSNKDCIKAIKEIDHGKYIGDGRVLSSFAGDMAINIESLSTGCKTILNIVSNPDKIFNITECGNNAVDFIFGLSYGRILIPCCMVVPIGICDRAMIHCNEQKKVIDDPCSFIMEVMNERYGN